MQLTTNGLVLDDQASLTAFYTAQYQAIYGNDINLDPDSPDGQMMNIHIQATLDMQEQFLQIVNSFDPDLAVGRLLDQRVSINGIQRQAGTYTTTFVTVTVSQALTLYGVDQELQSVFTVSDNAGNQWQLQASIVLSTPGSYTMMFQSANPGKVLTTPNTITTPVSIVLGVTTINNPTTYATLGIDEESDNDLKIRRAKSTTLSSQGYREALQAALENISGMDSVQVNENNTSATDVNGIPGHSIWVIVSGTADTASIANAIYRKRNAGCGMRGAQTYTITRSDGTSFVVSWDVVQPEVLFVKLTVTSLDGITPPNIAAIRSGLVSTFAPGVAAKVNVNQVARLVNAIDSNALVTGLGFSSTHNGAYNTTQTPTALNHQFAIISADIIITPMQLNPSSSTLGKLLTRQLTALGGYGAVTYAVTTNVTGGSVSAGGLYTSGSTAGTDVVTATDAHSNTATASIAVS